MKRLLMFIGAALTLAIASNVSARADVFVDPPSFGRIVYGITGGLVVLPQDAWQGAYPDGSGPIATPNDAAFGGAAILVGGQTRYLGDQGALAGTAGSNTGFDFAGVGGAGAVNAAAVTPVFGSGLQPKANVLSVKLGFISADGWESSISVFGAPSISPLTTLFGTHTNSGTVGAATVADPFGFAYTDNVSGNTYYSDNPANNTGTAANKLYNHVHAYEYVSGSTDVYFIGFEDVNFNTKGNPGYHRFDYNDSVIAMTFQEVPEPAFFQMAGLMSLGAFGLLKLRRRTSA